MNIQIQEAEKTLKTIKGTYTETQYKLSKITNKDRILKASRKKVTVTYKGGPIRLSAEFLAENLQAIKE